MATSEMEMRAALDQHWAASAAGDLEAEHDIYYDDAICDYPQSGERIRGRRNIQALRGHHPDKPSGFNVRRMWVRVSCGLPSTSSRIRERLPTP